MGALFLKKRSSVAAIASMIGGGTLTVILMVLDADLPYKLDPNVFGLTFSAFLFLGINFTHLNIIRKNRKKSLD